MIRQPPPDITAERLLLAALIEAQKPKVRAAMRAQFETWRTWRNVRSIQSGTREGEELGRAADEAERLLDRLGV